MFAHSCLSESLETVPCRFLMEECSCDLLQSGSSGGDVGDKQAEELKKQEQAVLHAQGVIRHNKSSRSPELKSSFCNSLQASSNKKKSSSKKRTATTNKGANQSAVIHLSHS